SLCDDVGSGRRGQSRGWCVVLCGGPYRRSPDRRVRGMKTMSDTSQQELGHALACAAEAAGTFATLPSSERAAMMCDLADALERDGTAVGALGERETHLATGRLVGELARTAGQLRFLSDVVLDGGWLRATIDTADPAEPVLRPDTRSCRIPVGPVLVFAAG